MRTIGHLDLFQNGVLEGWACLSDTPHCAIPLDIFIDGNKVDTIMPDQYRSDLEQAGYGNGRCAFKYSIARPYCNGREREADVRFHDTGTQLPRSPQRALMPRAILTRFESDREPAALRGKNGWYFLCNDSNGGMEQYRGLLRFDHVQLERLREIHDQRVQYMSEKGIPYIFGVLPGKEHVYPEYLPDGIPSSQYGRLVDQIIGYMLQSSRLPICDFTPLLKTHKAQYKIFHRHDTHWNHVAGFYATRVLANLMQHYYSAITPISMDEMQLTEVTVNEGDLSGKLQMHWNGEQFVPCAEQQPVPPDINLRPVFKTDRAVRVVQPPEHLKVSPSRATKIYEQDNPHLPRAVIFRGSSVDWMIPYLSTHFSRCVYIWQSHLNHAVIEAEKPDIVLHLMAERFLIALPES